MRYFARAVSILIILGLFAACGGRTAHPVKREQVGDDRLSCGDIIFETKSNVSNIQILEKERQRIKRKNGVKAALFFMIFPPFTLDLQMAPEAEMEALETRNTYLASLYGQRCKRP